MARFPLEMHMVHRNLRYPNLGEALDRPDGVAVVAVLFEKDPYQGQGMWMDGVKPYKKLCDVSCTTCCKQRLLYSTLHIPK